MSNRSPPSSPGDYPAPSSPPTQYSPQATRKGVQVNPPSVGESSAMAAARAPYRTTPLPSRSITHASIIVRGISYQGLHPTLPALGAFSNELDREAFGYISRDIFVEETPSGVHCGTDEIREFQAVQFQLETYRVFTHAVPVYNEGVIIHFDNLRDACEGMQLLKSIKFDCSFVDTYDFAIARGQDTAAINEFQGQLKLTIMLSSTNRGPRPPFPPSELVWFLNAIESALSVFGSVRHFAHLATDEEKLLFTFRVEFFSVEACSRAVASLTVEPLWGESDDGIWNYWSIQVGSWSGPRPATSPHRRYPRRDHLGRLVGHLHNAESRRDLRYRTHPGDLQNRVRRDRIEDGTEIRTTIMLRNIPNKLDWMSLKQILDTHAFGQFNCLYLRIDFQTGQNMGYAFVNFTDVAGLLAVLDHLEGYPWHGFSSNKVLECSFATIQGSEALIERFRNSAVRQSAPYCRPHLFLTHHEAVTVQRTRDAGKELPLPPPNNLSKLQRSTESANCNGLYKTPGMCRHHSGSRVIGSGYDRGHPRDNAYMFERYGPPPQPPKFQALEVPEHMRRNCEQWYACHYGPNSRGTMTRFEDIGLAAVHQFLALHGRDTRLYFTNPGPIRPPSVRTTIFNPTTTQAGPIPQPNTSFTGTGHVLGAGPNGDRTTVLHHSPTE